MVKYNIGIICIIFVIDLMQALFREKREEKISVKKILKGYIKGEKFWKNVTEILIIVLGVTLATQVNDKHEKSKQKDKLVDLLQASQNEIEASLSFNNCFCELYENDKVTITFLKNADCTLNTLEKIVENDDMIINMSSVSYSTFCNYIDLAYGSYKAIKEADNEDETILLEMKGLCKEQELLLFQIHNEIAYLSGEYTLGELRERTAEYKNNNKGIEVLSSDLFSELKKVTKSDIYGY